MIRSNRMWLRCGLGAAVILGLAGCTTNSQVAWEADGTPQHTHPGQNWWRYQFVYHPDEQVYYNTYSQKYYWFEEGIWHEGKMLPTHIPLSGKHARAVKVFERQPHIQHDSVVAMSGPFNFPFPSSLETGVIEEENFAYTAVPTDGEAE